MTDLSNQSGLVKSESGIMAGIFFHFRARCVSLGLTRWFGEIVACSTLQLLDDDEAFVFSQVVHRFQELFTQTKYKKVAELAAESPQGILHTPET